MRSVFKQLMAEFHAVAIPQLTRRDIQLPSLPKSVRKAFVYIGMRRSGKTYCLFQRMQELIEAGVHKSEMLYINFEDDRLSGMQVSDFQLLLEAYWTLYPEHVNSKKLHFFFDEIAEIDGWQSFIRRLLDSETMQVYVTGSSAKILSKEIATNLRGRTLTREVFPMSFNEYLCAIDVPVNDTMTAKQKSVKTHHMQHYLRWGGFPEVLGVNPTLHRELLQGYMDSVIYRDIIERYGVKNNVALRQLLRHCLQNAASSLSINKLYLQFKSRGMAISKDALYEFMHYFEDAYCLFSVPVYSFSLSKAELKPKKVYPVDNGLISAYSIKPGFDEAALLETQVFLHQRRMCDDIYYYQTKSSYEVDFLSVFPNGAMMLHQVSLSLEHENTKAREVRALQEAMRELKLNKATIVTLSDLEEIEVPEGTIHVIPLIDYLV